MFLNLFKLSKRNQDFNLINSASELTLDKFIDCIVNRNLKILIKKGEIETNVLEQAWDKIYDEYLSILKNRDQSYIYHLQKDILLLEFKMSQINLCVTYLLCETDEKKINEVLKELQKLTFVIGKFDVNDRQSFELDIQRVLSNARKLIVEHEEKIQEFNNLLKSDDEKLTEASFDALIIKLSKYMQFKIDKKITTVSEFAHMVHDYNYYIQQMNEHYAKQTENI